MTTETTATSDAGRSYKVSTVKAEREATVLMLLRLRSKLARSNQDVSHIDDHLSALHNFGND